MDHFQDWVRLVELSGQSTEAGLLTQLGESIRFDIPGHSPVSYCEIKLCEEYNFLA